MPDFKHFRFSYSKMNPVLGRSAYPIHQPQNLGASLSDPGFFSDAVYGSPDQGFYLEEPGQGGLDSGLLSRSLSHLHRMHPNPPHPPAAALRNDLGSNISVLKTLNVRFRCFLAKVHELERRNKALENQLQQALESSNHDKTGCGQDKPGTRDSTVQTGFIGTIPLRPDLIPIHNANNFPCMTGSTFGSALNATHPLKPTDNIGILDPKCVIDSNSNLAPTFPHSPVSRRSSSPTPRFLPSPSWLYTPSGRFSNGCELKISNHRVSWPCQNDAGVQIDTITPELRALYNVLSKVRRERDEFKLRWEEEYSVRVDLQERMAELEEDLHESELCKDELTFRVKQLKAELVLFKGLMSSNLSELDSKIQEKAMKVDMDICRRIDITARLCDVAQKRNCEDMIQIFQMATPPSTLPRRSQKQSQSVKIDADEPLSISESEESGTKDLEPCCSSTSQVNEEMQRMLNQLRESEFEDDCDSLAWEETEETLLLWEDFPGYSVGVDTQGEPDELLEEVIKGTESLFNSREKEYQTTIDQIELDLATAKSDMNRHLHEYMEMCSMKRGLDVQMETCRRLITQTRDRKSPLLFSITVEDEEKETERKKSFLCDYGRPESNNPSFIHPT